MLTAGICVAVISMFPNGNTSVPDLYYIPVLRRYIPTAPDAMGLPTLHIIARPTSGLASPVLKRESYSLRAAN